MEKQRKNEHLNNSMQLEKKNKKAKQKNMKAK